VRILRGEIDKSDNVSATAYVVFKTVEATDKAIALTGCVFKERHLSIGGETPEAKPFEPRSSVYLGNLPYNVTDEHLWSFFKEQGLLDVTRVRIPRDHNSTAWGNAKGFGYVEFRSRESVVKALKLKQPLLADRKIRIFSVHKSKDAVDTRVTRRDKRAVAAASAAPKNNKNDKTADSKKTSKNANSALAVVASSAGTETPSWMGQTTDPRKKLSKELRWLTQHPNDRRAAAKSRHKDRVRAEFIKKKKSAKASE
jgi:nucleolar protein 12